MTTAALTQPFHFTSFSVQRCIRIKYETDVVYRPIHAQQNEAILQMLAGQTSLRTPAVNLELITVEIDGDEQVLIDQEDGEFFNIAHGSCEHGIYLSSGTFEGVYWRVLGFVDGSDSLRDAMQLVVGDCEASIRSTCMGLQALVRLPTAIRAYNDKINREETAPDGGDYNALLELAGI